MTAMSEGAEAGHIPLYDGDPTGGRGPSARVLRLPAVEQAPASALDLRARELATARCALFEGVPLVLRREMVADGFARPVLRGEAVYLEGTPSGWGFVVAQGTVALGRNTPGRKRQFMTLFLAGDVFGMVNVLGGTAYTARAVAVSDGLLLQVPAETILAWPTLDPRVARSMVAYLSNQVLRANGSVAGLLCPDVSGKLATFLLDLAGRIGAPSSDGTILRLALSQEQLAQHVGASRESVNRALRDMVKRKVIVMEHGEMRLLDKAWLQRKSERA